MLDAPAQAVLESSGALPVLSSLDPPGHARYRRQMTTVFPATDRRANDLDILLREETARAAHGLAARADRTGDLVEDWARPLATAVLGRLAAIPAEDQPAVLDRAAALSHLVWGHLDDAAQVAAAHALGDLFAYCLTLAEQRSRTAGGDDLISGWLTHQDAGGKPFTTREVAFTLMEVLITNAEITPRLLANTLYRLLTTGTFEEVHRTGRWPEAVAETLRHDPPLAGWLRSTTREVRLSGTPIPAGARLLLLLASAGRGECQPRPPRTDGSRERLPRPHPHPPGPLPPRHLAAQHRPARSRPAPRQLVATERPGEPGSRRTPDHLSCGFVETHEVRISG
ncbi:hypothetical protein [Streptomyces sp. NPDC048269]|uniref:hypothetical protein n=1 Tax=Streptomyces sp. NPDC048269 TaxID=3155753 RepID=UPI003429C089